MKSYSFDIDSINFHFFSRNESVISREKSPYVCTLHIFSFHRDKEKNVAFVRETWVATLFVNTWFTSTKQACSVPLLKVNSQFFSSLSCLFSLQNVLILKSSRLAMLCSLHFFYCSNSFSQCKIYFRLEDRRVAHTRWCKHDPYVKITQTHEHTAAALNQTLCSWWSARKMWRIFNFHSEAFEGREMGRRDCGWK